MVRWRSTRPCSIALEASTICWAASLGEPAGVKTSAFSTGTAGWTDEAAPPLPDSSAGRGCSGLAPSRSFGGDSSLPDCFVGSMNLGLLPAGTATSATTCVAAGLLFRLPSKYPPVPPAVRPTMRKSNGADTGTFMNAGMNYSGFRRNTARVCFVILMHRSSLSSYHGSNSPIRLV